MWNILFYLNLYSWKKNCFCKCFLCEPHCHSPINSGFSDWSRAIIDLVSSTGPAGTPRRRRADGNAWPECLFVLPILYLFLILRCVSGGDWASWASRTTRNSKGLTRISASATFKMLTKPQKLLSQRILQERESDSTVCHLWFSKVHLWRCSRPSNRPLMASLI